MALYKGKEMTVLQRRKSEALQLLPMRVKQKIKGV